MINQGISFGLFQGLSVWVFVLVLLALVIYAVKVRELWERVGLILIILGGAFNLLSRILYGGVMDNLSFFGLVYNNPADYLIFIGAVVYGYTYFVRR